MDGGTLCLIGPDEPTFWPAFKQSTEYQDGQPNPMDRWSLRILNGIAQDIGARAIVPFQVPPFHPFQTWALQTGRFATSAIGFLVHDERGLFASFRGALWLPVVWPAAANTAPDISATAMCAAACPVKAFADGYDVAACKAHVTSPQGQDCRDNGCLSRRACAIGRDRRLPEQSAFHMKAFL